jgi:G:T-mismatch repair DNA endonuclease (very short patch repair protein)
MNAKNKICPFCGCKFSARKHLYKCNSEISRDDSYIAMVELNYNLKVTHLISDYVDKFMSLPDLKKKYSIPYKVSLEVFEIMNIKKRSLSDSTNSEKCIEQRKETSIKIYGVDNPSKSDVIKDKKRKTFIENYGVDNIYKTTHFKEYLNNLMLLKYVKLRTTNPEKISDSRKKFTPGKWEEIEKKIKNTSLEKYGVTNVSKLDKNRKKHSEAMIGWWKGLSDLEKEERINRNFNLVSGLEITVRNILDNNMIIYDPQRFIGGKSYDILIRFTNLIIEINGDYWHANPNKYSGTDFINYPGIGQVTASSVWDRDIEKIALAEKYGYKVITIWEDEIKREKKAGNLEFFIINKLYENSKN